MEKFNNWRDRGTGIHPFLHASKKDNRSMIKYQILGPIVSSVKSIGIVTVIILWFLLYLTSHILIIPYAVNGTNRFFTIFFSRLLLGFFGYYSIPIKRKQKQTARLIISNHSSYIDLLLHMYMYQPIFLACNDELVKPVSIWNLFWNGLHQVDVTNGIPINDYLQQTTQNIVLFPEMCLSNNKSLLEFVKILDHITCPIHIVGIQYEWDTFCPCFTVGSKIQHVWYLLCQFQNKVHIIEYGTIKHEKKCTDQVSIQLASTLQVPRVSLGRNDYNHFLIEYEKKK